MGRLRTRGRGRAVPLYIVTAISEGTSRLFTTTMAGKKAGHSSQNRPPMADLNFQSRPNAWAIPLQTRLASKATEGQGEPPVLPLNQHAPVSAIHPPVSPPNLPAAQQHPFSAPNQHLATPALHTTRVSPSLRITMDDPLNVDKMA